MPLPPGTRLGYYEVVGAIGAGGMGEVYRARDARLNRDVALKVLPASFASDVDRLRRFTLEAQTAGALNHPNVLTVFEIGDHDGQPFLAAELLTGETIREKLSHGPIPVSKAIDYACQTASGLSAAHARQITHRDIKPENLFVTTDGRLKILDFGLAKQSGSNLNASDDTRLESGTSRGVVLGTVGYMSPEQVRARPVDQRSDLFSLGVVLYEMLSGERPFAGGSAVETMNAILTQDAAEIASPGRGLPPAIAEIVRHCLEKQPDERFQSARDLAFALQATSGLSGGSASGSMSSSTAAPLVATGGTRARRRVMAISTAAALAGAIAGAGALWLANPARDSLDLQHRRFTPLAMDATDEWRPTWSPDGRSLAYFSSVGTVASLLVKDLGASAPVTLVRNLRRSEEIFWWPDGNRVGFSGEGGIWSVSRAGGDPEQVQQGWITAASLSPDGRTLAFWKMTTNASTTTAALWFASPPDGSPVKYRRGFVDIQALFPAFLKYAPDGSRVVISGYLPDSSKAAEVSPSVWEIPGTSVETMLSPRRLFASGPLERPPSFGWLDKTHLVLAMVGGPGLWLGDIGRDRLAKITDGLGGEADPGVSPDGRRIAFESRRDDYDTIEIPLDGSPIVDVLAASPDEFGASRTKDGRIVYVSNASGIDEVRLRSADGSDRSVVIQPRDFPNEAAGRLLAPKMSPDGQRIVFGRLVQSQLDAWIVPASGGTPVRATAPRDPVMLPSWSPDGKWIAFVITTRGTNRLMKQRVGASEPPQILVDGLTPYSGRCEWSPDGKSIALVTVDGLSLIPPAGGVRRLLTPNLQPAAMTWTADARTLYGLIVDDEGARIVSIDAATGATRTIRALPANLEFRTPINPGLHLTLNVEGTRLLTTAKRSRSDIWMMEGFER